MRFAVGLLDYLFGEKVRLDVPTSDGQTRRRAVTRRWLEQMKREGKMQEVDGEVVRVHHIGLHGYEIEHQCDRSRHFFGHGSMLPRSSDAGHVYDVLHGGWESEDLLHEEG